MLKTDIASIKVSDSTISVIARYLFAKSRVRLSSRFWHKRKPIMNEAETKTKQMIIPVSVMKL